MNYTTIDRDQAKLIINRSSNAGKFALYSFIKSFEAKQAFDRVDFTKQTYITTADYFYGFLVACFSFNLIDFNYKGLIITPTYVNEVLAKEVNNYFQQFKSQNQDDQNLKAEIEKIEKYFINS